MGNIYSKVLMDADNGVYVKKWSISSGELGVDGSWRIEKHRLYGGLSDGVDIVTVDNGEMSFTVVPTRGMGIWRGEFKGVFLGWASPVTHLVNPCYINLEERGGLGWLRGFNEWIVRCGLGSFGAPGPDIIKDNMGRDIEVLLTLHGRIANTPASYVKVKVELEPPFKMGVEGVVYENSMFGSNLKLTTSVTTTPGSNSLEILDVIENLRGTPDKMQILYHCNYGKPLLDEGSCFVAPIKRVAPRDKTAMKNIESFDVFGAPEKGFIEQVYFMELLGDRNGYTSAMLVSKDLDKAVSHTFSIKELPYFTLWKNTAAEEDGYVVGIEPGTGFPNTRRFERKYGRVIKLGPGEKYRVQLNISVHLGRSSVKEAIDRIENIRGGVEPTIYKEPLKEFSP
ncbi:MAG: aldose 1-epimerase family protein [Candidatus Bathyarchaeota archaeon]|nr:aldose 1-epimerase family protein [Candidatus Bathyarchaeota archaeon]